MSFPEIELCQHLDAAGHYDLRVAGQLLDQSLTLEEALGQALWLGRPVTIRRGWSALVTPLGVNAVLSKRDHLLSLKLQASSAFDAVEFLADNLSEVWVLERLETERKPTPGTVSAH